MSASDLDTYPRLVGDVGGTNARFAVIAGPGATIENIDTLPCADYSGPADAIKAYLARHGLPTPHSGAIGIANPVTGDAIRMTNHTWAFSIEAERKAIGLKELIFINDFTALALSLPHLGEDERYAVGGGEAVKGAPIGVIGPGTGLGVSGLIPYPGGHYTPLQGEGGHVTLSGQTDEELAVLQALMRRYPHVSAERAVSGPGMAALYLALAETRSQKVEPLDAPAIREKAVNGSDKLCVDTVNMFCALLATAAADLALTLGAFGGIYIGGGIVPKLGDFFLQSPFRSRFETKGRFSQYLARIPTFVITAKYPALIGSSVALEYALRHRAYQQL
ncbi:glucokinase [Uliginosibacterium sp. sgz301328]|uniref:glucokinase n=1 Tax=Uliginosibacterium sp. sgz301328 TaxID=3243764 RepID=UPI00359D333E